MAKPTMGEDCGVVASATCRGADASIVQRVRDRSDRSPDKDADRTCYLLSVHNDDTPAYATPKDAERAFAATGCLNEEMPTAGVLDDATKSVRVGALFLYVRLQEQGIERARGATALDDWADRRWVLVKHDGQDRYLCAEGRMR